MFSGTVSAATWTVGPNSTSYNYTAIQAAVDGSHEQDTIIVYSNGTYTYNENIVINKNLTLNGRDNATLHGSFTITSTGSGSTIKGFNVTQFDSNRLITVQTGANNVKLEDLILSNATLNDNGGAIYNAGGTASMPNHINNCTITENKALNGGAIQNYGTLNISNSNLNNNNAVYNGGVIENYGTITITGSDMHNNDANTDGGAIINWGTVIINDSTLNKNRAIVGGAIWNNGVLNITGSSLNYNTATTGGGAIINWETCTVNYCSLVGNSAPNGNAIHTSGLVDARYNWWGSNNNPSGELDSDYVTYSPWLVLNITVDKSSINYNGTCNVTVDLLHDSTNTYHDPVIEGHVPEGIPVTLTTDWGNITNTIPSTMKNGKIEVIYNANGTKGFNNPVNVYATVDNEKVNKEITITSIPTTITVKSTSNYPGKQVTLTANVISTSGNNVNNGTVNFKVNETNIGIVNVVNGQATAVLTIPSNWKAGKYIIKATYSGTSDLLTSNNTAILTVNTNTPTVTIQQLIIASKQIKKYAESHNYKIPVSLKVAGKTLTMPQLLRLLVTATVNISKSNLKPVKVTNIKSALYSIGYVPLGSISTNNYIRVAKNINIFIKENTRAPNYARTVIDNVPFNRLVYIYAKIVDFYRTHNRLPNYVYTAKTT